MEQQKRQPTTKETPYDDSWLDEFPDAEEWRELGRLLTPGNADKPSDETSEWKTGN